MPMDGDYVVHTKGWVACSCSFVLPIFYLSVKQLQFCRLLLLLNLGWSSSVYSNFLDEYKNNFRRLNAPTSFAIAGISVASTLPA